MRAAKYDTATGRISGVRMLDDYGIFGLPPLPAGMAYLGLSPDQACDPDLHRVVDGAIVAKLAISADTLDRWRRERKAEAQAVRQAVEDGLCATPLGIIQTPPASRVNILGLVAQAERAIAAGKPFEQMFRMADNRMVDHDAAAMIALGDAVAGKIKACSAAYFAIADAINASDDPAAIDIAAGYPPTGTAAPDDDQGAK